MEAGRLGLRPEAADLIARLHGDAGRRWLHELPALVSHAERRWRLRVGAAYPGCTVAFVAPARRLDGGLQVIKAVPGPDEAWREAAALEQWHGRLAPRLLEFDRERGILLLEAVEPGDAAELRCPRDEWARIAGGVARRLWAQSPAAGAGLPRVSAALRDWIDEIDAWRRRPGADSDLAAFGIEVGARLAGHDRAAIPVLVHGDLHPGNLLWDSSKGWVAIDPQPLFGDAAYDAGAVVRAVMPPSPTGSQAMTVVRSVAGAMGLDEEPVLGWGLLRHLMLSVRWISRGVTGIPADLTAARALQAAATR
ncbi:MAG: phosphotransferase [Acidimicrobiaceae bacterium]|nr:phosphotransferase [Acidimicrobiaceae bacterium]